MTTNGISPEELRSGGYPDAGEMLRMVNEDLLPWFAENFPSQASAAPVEQLSERAGYDFIFTRNDNSTLAVWESYFRDPEAWKTHRLNTRRP